MKYVTESSVIETDFSVKANPAEFLNNIRINRIRIEEAKLSQEGF